MEVGQAFFSANRVLFLLEGVSRAPGKAVKVKGTRLVVTGEPQQLGCPVLRRDTDDQVNVDVPVLELASVIKLSESLYLYDEFYHYKKRSSFETHLK